MLLRTSVAGVEVRFERSWTAALLVLSVVTAWSARALMPDELGLLTSLAFGLAVALALTVSLLLHELAHARVSINAGIGVEHVRIFAGGALCRRRDPIRHADHQFRVAAAGPIASLALGLAVLIAAFVVELFALPATVSAGLGFVAFANMIVAVSNMLPLLPFDGGKVLHAVFWRATGDHDVATKRLHRGGREFARIVVSLGIIMMAWANELALGLVVAGFGIYLMFLRPAPG